MLYTIELSKHHGMPGSGSAVLQLIDEEKRFNPATSKFFKDIGIENNGLDYHLVSVFGSQSTGKSTLLNAMFGTNFDVMNEMKRAQTTKGMWLGSCPDEHRLLVLDVEGSDGRERGEDQDFERKAALFALATSEVLIVNMWEHQVGLYQGANMGLLKTVFEVNLSLFQTGGRLPARSEIFFVLRDYTGLTPLSNLAQTLTEDLERQWSAIAKPTKELENTSITEFFDLKFATLPHKVLQREQFMSQTSELRKRFVKGDAFRPEYHRKVPIDGWPMYAEQVWQQIEENKDLDLPTQQILVARFRCDDIAAEAWNEFNNKLSALDLKGFIPDFGKTFGKIRLDALEFYDNLAGKYYPQVYNEKRFELLGKVDGFLTQQYSSQLAEIHNEAIKLFKSELKKGNGSFVVSLAAALGAAREFFLEKANEATIDPSFYSFSEKQVEFEGELEKEVSNARKAEISRTKQRLGKRLNKQFDDIGLYFDTTEEPWDAIKARYDTVLKEALAMDFQLGETEDVMLPVQAMVETTAWDTLLVKIREIVREDAVVQRLRDRFEESFRFDKDGLPRVWTAKDDVEGANLKGRDAALRILPKFKAAVMSDGKILEGPSQSEEDSDGEDDDDKLDLAELLSESQLDAIKKKFIRFTNAAFVEAKNSASRSSTHIPTWMYVLLIVLGWNEFMTVLRNPLLVILCLLILAGAYTLNSLHLTGTVLNTVQASSKSFINEFKAWLRKQLEEPHQHPQKVTASPSHHEGNDESFPIDPPSS